MDVHKSFVVACIASTDSVGVTSYKSRRFSTFTKDLKLLAAWLSNNNCRDVCMESTGKYWIPVYNILESSCRIVLAHPKYVKAIRGKKTDVKDAKWIADIFKHDLVSGSFIPPYEIRQLRDLMRYRYKLTNFSVGEKNRAQNCLTVSNIKLDDVFSDVFGKSSSAISTNCQFVLTAVLMLLRSSVVNAKLLSHRFNPLSTVLSVSNSYTSSALSVRT